MKSFILSQTGIYRLQQLSHIVKQKTGIRHKLSKLTDTINLLRYSSISPDETIYSVYGEFIDSLSDDQRIYLQSRGILLPSPPIHLQDNHDNTFQVAR